jgi:hypothetical protein
MLLDLNLQMFADGEDDNDLDIDSMLAEFEEEWEDSEDEESTEDDSTEDVQEVEETEEQTEEANPNDDDADRRNRAFADLRRQAQENEKYAKFIQRLAEEGGVKPDDLLARYEERNLQAQAKTIDPVELLRRQNSTESELSTLKEQMRAERMDAQINQVVDKYGADDDSIREAFKYMVETGIDPRTADNVNFEKFYRAANLDSIIQKEVANAKQQDLENKKKRQESASIGNGKSVSPSSGDLSDDDFDSIMKSLDMRL